MSGIIKIVKRNQIKMFKKEGYRLVEREIRGKRYKSLIPNLVELVMG